jgi:hypothetical protein
MGKRSREVAVDEWSPAVARHRPDDDGDPPPSAPASAAEASADGDPPPAAIRAIAKGLAAEEAAAAARKARARKGAPSKRVRAGVPLDPRPQKRTKRRSRYDDTDSESEDDDESASSTAADKSSTESDAEEDVPQKFASKAEFDAFMSKRHHMGSKGEFDKYAARYMRTVADSHFRDYTAEDAWDAFAEKRKRAAAAAPTATITAAKPRTIDEIHDDLVASFKKATIAADELRDIRTRTDLSTDLLRDLRQCGGDRRLANIQRILNSCGVTRSVHQKQFHEAFINACLPKSVARCEYAGMGVVPLLTVCVCVLSRVQDLWR